MTETFYRINKKSSWFVANELRKAIPDLQRLSTEEVDYAIKGLNIEYLYREKVKANPFIRLTLPLAAVVWVLMMFFLPVNYLLVGKWGYQNEFLENWFRSLS